jgi:hypothetical protein
MLPNQINNLTRQSLAITIIFLTLAASQALSAENQRSLVMSLGGFSGSDTSGVAIGFYSLRPKRIGWYINGTVSSRADEDEDDDFRPIPEDTRVDEDTESTTVNVGLTFTVGPLAPYAGVGITQISEYGLYRTSSDAYWYKEKDNTDSNFNFGVVFLLGGKAGLDLGANNANDEIVLGLSWTFQ